MNNDNHYFYVSGLISLSLFLLFAAIVIYMLVSPDRAKNFALKKDNYISVSIVVPKSVSSSEQTQVKEESSVINESKEIDIDNLFSEVETKSISKTPPIKKIDKEESKRRIIEIQKKISKSDKNVVETISKKIKNKDISKVEKESINTSTAKEVNEYLAKIQALVYQYFYPPQNSQGNSVEAVIELSSIGKVYDFRILRYSSNRELNSECDKIKHRLMSVVFPEHPEKKSGIYTITLTSKE